MIAHKITTTLIGIITGVLVLFSPGNAQAPTQTTQVATLALAEGLPQSELETALRVAVRESRCTSDAYNALDPNGGSYGIYQINGFWCRPNENWPIGWLQAKGIVTDCADLFDPTINTRAMVAIWRNSGWLPWSTSK